MGLIFMRTNQDTIGSWLKAGVFGEGVIWVVIGSCDGVSVSLVVDL